MFAYVSDCSSIIASNHARDRDTCAGRVLACWCTRLPGSVEGAGNFCAGNSLWYVGLLNLFVSWCSSLQVTQAAYQGMRGRIQRLGVSDLVRLH